MMGQIEERARLSSGGGRFRLSWPASGVAFRRSSWRASGCKPAHAASSALEPRLSTEHLPGSRPARDGRLVSGARRCPINRLATHDRRMSLTLPRLLAKLALDRSSTLTVDSHCPV